MIVFTSICLLLTIGYAMLMLAYRAGWHRQKNAVLPAEHLPGTSISVIVPARNEANNIRKCLDALIAQNYPAYLYEIIVVDDHSEDGTAQIVSKYGGNVTCISLQNVLPAGQQLNSYKKAALAAGIAASGGTLIVTTDADCTAGPEWLKQIAAIYEREQPAMIVAPVTFTSDGSIVQQFQLVDFMSMQGITAAAHALKLGNMSNGANLAFSRAAYNEVNGYTGIDHLASGDDFLLMMKIQAKYPNGIAYLKSQAAIVTTPPQPTWRSFLRQRVRWASKSGKYGDQKLTAILLLVYVFNLCLLGATVTAGLGALPWLTVALMLIIKVGAELIFIAPVCRFFKRSASLPYLVVLQPLHILYIVAAGFLGFAGKYEWKGRTVK